MSAELIALISFLAGVAVGWLLRYRAEMRGLYGDGTIKMSQEEWDAIYDDEYYEAMAILEKHG